MYSISCSKHIKRKKKIIFITGYAEEDLTDYLDQITHIVTKPFSIDSLADGINCI